MLIEIYLKNSISNNNKKGNSRSQNCVHHILSRWTAQKQMQKDLRRVFNQHLQESLPYNKSFVNHYLLFCILDSAQRSILARRRNANATICSTAWSNVSTSLRPCSISRWPCDTLCWSRRPKICAHGFRKRRKWKPSITPWTCFSTIKRAQSPNFGHPCPN